MFEKELDQWIDSYCKSFPFSGSICIRSGNNVIYRRDVGLSNRELNVPIDNKTRFRLYSMTKPFTALGLLRLYEMGRVSLDDHPGKYLPQAVSLHPNITIRSLLDHTHGMPDIEDASDYNIYLRGCPYNVNEVFDRVKSMPMDFVPGEACKYTSTGFLIISMIIEAISGMSWKDYMEKEVFAPLGMKDALIDSAYRIIPNRASGYDVDGCDIIAAPYLCIDTVKGGGDAVGTIEDVSCLYLAARNKSYLKPETWEMVFTPNKSGFGLGCGVHRWHEKIRYQHNGGHLGFRTLHVHLPEDDLSIILLSNMGFGNARAAFPEAIYSRYYKVNQEKEYIYEMDKGFARNSSLCYPVHVPQRPPFYECALECYVGRYQNGYNYVYVDMEEIAGVVGLRITYPDKRRVSIYPIAPGKFFNRIIDESYEFIKNAEGKYSFDGMIRMDE